MLSGSECKLKREIEYLIDKSIRDNEVTEEMGCYILHKIMLEYELKKYHNKIKAEEREKIERGVL